MSYAMAVRSEKTLTPDGMRGILEKHGVRRHGEYELRGSTIVGPDPLYTCPNLQQLLAQEGVKISRRA